MEQIIANIGYFLELVMLLISFNIVWNVPCRFRMSMCILVLSNGVVLTLINNDIVPRYWIYSIYVIAYIYCYCEFKRSMLETIIKFIIAISLAGVLEVLSAFVLAPVDHVIHSQSQILVLVNAVSVALASAVLLIFSKQKNQMVLKIKNKGFYQVILMFAIFISFMFIDYAIHNESDAVYDLMIFLLMLLIYFFLFKMQKAENELAKKSLELKLHRIYSDTYEELLVEVRQRQHDFKNQLTAIYGMHLTAESLEDLVKMQKEYFERLEANSQYDQILTKCNEPILAGYLYYKCIAFEKAGVKICGYTINIDKADCIVAVYELIEILGIFMDNACEQVIANELENRKIAFEFFENKEQIVFEIGNPSQFLSSSEIEKMFTEGYSTKGQNRGLGLYRIKQLVMQYNLELIVTNNTKFKSFEDNWLVFKLVIKK